MAARWRRADTWVKREPFYSNIVATVCFGFLVHATPTTSRLLDSSDKTRGARRTGLTKTPCAARRTSGSDPRLPAVPARNRSVVDTVQLPQSRANFCSQYTPSTLAALESGPRSPQHARASHGLRVIQSLARISRSMRAKSDRCLLLFLRCGVKSRPCRRAHGHSARG